MQNVQNLLCFLDESTFFKVTKLYFVKKEEKWAKSTFWASFIINVCLPKNPFFSYLLVKIKVDLINVKII